MSYRVDPSDVADLAVNPPRMVLTEMADAARRTYCRFYSEHPGWILAKKTITLPIVTRTLDYFCGDFPPPPQPASPPFEGGQCEGVEYEVLATADRYYYDGENQPISSRLVVYGAIEQIFVGRNSPANDPRILALQCFAHDAQGSPKYFGDVYGGVGWTAELTSLEVRRLDGQSDNCGSLPIEYPPEAPPSPSDLNQTINITNFNGDIVEYNVKVDVDNSGGITFPGNIEINGAKVQIDAGGINITNRRGGGGGGGSGENEPPEENIFEEEQEEEVVVETEEKLIGLTITLSGNLKTFESTSGRGAPDVYYAGWVEFKLGDFFYPRQFIHFLKSRFEAPDKVDGYAITLKEGWSSSVEEVKMKVPKQP